MRTLLNLMAERLTAGDDLVLVTVIASSGSTPRGMGARMLVSDAGRLAGTIGGGMVEYRSVQIAADVLREKTSGEQCFSLTDDDVQALGMICGGAVSIFFRYIPAGDEATLDLCKEALRRFAKGCDLWLLSDIGNNGALALWSAREGCFGADCPEWTAELMTRHPIRETRDGRDFYIEQINSSGRVYIFGCGHVAQELAPVLAHVGFRCVCLDDRPEFANRELFPTADDVRLIDFSDIAKSVDLRPEDYVCVMTRGHAFDTLVQEQVLKSPACYIGVIGSAKKAAGVQSVLRRKGFTDADFERVITPIGLKIKAETPAEIAISIAGQLILHRAERSANRI